MKRWRSFVQVIRARALTRYACIQLQVLSLLISFEADSRLQLPEWMMCNTAVLNQNVIMHINYYHHNR